MAQTRRVLVTGAGGFIGHHLTNRLVADGNWVRGVDIKYPEYEPTRAQSFEILDLRRWSDCLQATREIVRSLDSRRPRIVAMTANATPEAVLERHRAHYQR